AASPSRAIPCKTRGIAPLTRRPLACRARRSRWMSDFRDFARQIPRAATVRERLEVAETSYRINWIMLRFLTAGESHGEALVAVLDGMPAGLSIDLDAITTQVRRRQGGYGRGRRMAIESDRAQILSGIRRGVTMGGPISLLIPNKDWQNWQKTMHVAPETPADATGANRAPVTRPRPGHADLAGVLKYGLEDIRDVLERASARETAARVA